MSMVVAATRSFYKSGMASVEGDDGQDETLGEEKETNKRSERKRQREKQRRIDLSKAFDDLAALMVAIEPEAGDADADAKKKRKKSGDGDEASGITRLERIERAMNILKRLHRENEELKATVANLRERGLGGHGDNVVMALPVLTPATEDHYRIARGSFPTFPAHHAPFYSNSHHTAAPPHHAATHQDYPLTLPPSRLHPYAPQPPPQPQPPPPPPPTWGTYARSPHQQSSPPSLPGGHHSTASGHQQHPQDPRSPSHHTPSPHNTASHRQSGVSFDRR